MKYLLIFLPLFCFGQNKYLNKSDIGAICFSFGAGVWQGAEEVVHFKYKTFHSIHPNINEQYFNPAISWKNKYRMSEPFQSCMTGYSDFYHYTRLQSRTNYTLAMVFSYGDFKKFNLWHILIKGALCCVASGCGRTLVYNIIY